MAADRFVGRGDAVAALGAVLRGEHRPDGNLAILSIEGPGGIGKTCLFEHVLLTPELFRGKVVRVTGKVQKAPITNGMAYQLCVRSSKDIEIVTPTDAPKAKPPANEQPAAKPAKFGYLKAEACGRLVHADRDYRLIVRQNKLPEIELLLRTNADKSILNKILFNLKDQPVAVSGDVVWLPKGAQVNSDDDYALGIVLSDKAQIRVIDSKDAPLDYLKVEAKGMVVWKDSFHLHVQLQEKPARKLVFGFWVDEPNPLFKKLNALKDREAIVSGNPIWNPKSTSDFGFSQCEVKPAGEAKEFEELTVAFRTGGVAYDLPSTIRIGGDGHCVYEVAGRPAIGTSPAWNPSKITHTLPPDRFRRLTGMLKDTDWLRKAAPKHADRLHANEYTLTLKRDGKEVTVSCKREQEPYTDLLNYLRGVSRQEFLLYLLESVPSKAADARRLLDTYIGAELDERSLKLPDELDYRRYAAWATGLVRKPAGKSAEDVKTAIRVVGLLRLESERKSLVALASAPNSTVREAAAQALGRFKGGK